MQHRFKDSSIFQADDISAMSIIGNYFRSINLDNVVVVSPDHGGVTRARRLAEMLHAPLSYH